MRLGGRDVTVAGRVRGVARFVGRGVARVVGRGVARVVVRVVLRTVAGVVLRVVVRSGAGRLVDRDWAAGGRGAMARAR
ncbi:MAG: hypothetical protein ACLPVF_12905 [Acidimicrobiales bacterium]